VRLLRRFAYLLGSAWTIAKEFASPWRVAWAVVARRRRQPFEVELRRAGLRFLVRGALDVLVVKETCLDLDYEHAGCAIAAGWRIVDIGAGLGEFAVPASRRPPGCVVHAYEPDPGSFSLLLRNLELNRATGVHAFPEAVSGAGVGLCLANPGASGSRRWFRPPDRWASAADAGARVGSTPLATVLGRLPGGHCDLLKLDCEGTEFDIVLASPEACWADVDRVVAEYHEGPATGGVATLIDALTRRGFAVRVRPNRSRKGLGYIFATRSGELRAGGGQLERA
jgi:FkbM family methyltransferase